MSVCPPQLSQKAINRNRDILRYIGSSDDYDPLNYPHRFLIVYGGYKELSGKREKIKTFTDEGKWNIEPSTMDMVELCPYDPEEDGEWALAWQIYLISMGHGVE